MIEVVEINFKEGGKSYYFSPRNLNLLINQKVVVETEKGMQIGEVIKEKEKIKEKKIKGALKEVIRVATKKDLENFENNKKEAQKAIKKCKKFIEEEQLEMNIIEAEYTLDKKTLTFSFLADKRVDFRNLVKNLAKTFKARIELKQIGVRDKAKEVGGLGQCGRVLCCKSFLKEFDTVSINMAKNQNIALNPNKINGACGRLLCCLNYENDCYKKNKKKLPKVGEIVSYGKENVTVKSVDVFNMKYTVETKNKDIIEIKYEEN
jgi:cell fate regulator YaaT (PSP1 superfamily)